MLSKQKLTETAIRLINRELTALTAYDHSDLIGELLCEMHCSIADCSHDSAESAREQGGVHQQVKEAVAFLRTALAQYEQHKH